MASLQKENGGWKIQTRCPDGIRRSIRLGPVSEKRAYGLHSLVEALILAADTDRTLDADTQRAVARLSPKLAKRFAKAGLINGPASADTLAAFIDRYIQQRADTKESTRAIYQVVRENVVEFLGPNKPIDRITEGDAEDFRRWLSVTKKLSANTCKRRCAVVKQFLAYAVKKHMIPANPFAVLKKLAVHENRERFVFIDRATIDKVLEKITDSEWRLMVALSRWGGLRCPSEHLSLRWTDILWDESAMIVRQPKLEHCEGHESRRVPIFPELMPFLREAFEAAPDGAEYCITQYRDTRVNLRKRFTMYIRKAGLEPWPRLWHALRASRQTELCQTFPVKAVCEWFGNSALVASRHYLMTTPADWEKAVTTPTPIREVVQKAVQQDVAGGNKTVAGELDTPICDPVQASATGCELEVIGSSGPLGLEPRTS